MPQENEKLIAAINKLEKTTNRATHLGWNVLRGFFYSIGWIIGLAFLATMAIYLLPIIGEGNAIGKFVHSIVGAIRQSQN
jgi:hypothetical protein